MVAVVARFARRLLWSANLFDQHDRVFVMKMVSMTPNKL
jgi:hypothetical protein